jgi:hypothetical protein
MKYVLFCFGILAVVAGVGIYGWVLYNLVWPTKEFQDNTNGTVGQYIFPGVMIAIGIKWILGIRKPAAAPVRDEQQDQ